MKKISLAILTLIVVFASCKKTPEVNLKYVDVERDLITVGTTTATVQCDYQYIATLKKACFHYGEGENEADMNTAEMRVVQNTLYVELDGLRANTTYSYYYEFYNGFNSMRTMTKPFKTESLPIALPTVITATVTEITTISAKGGGEVTNDGGTEVTERGICWSTTANPTISDSHVAAGTGTGVFAASMSGLEANTTYHVRAYATNEKGTAYGLDREFTTNRTEGALTGDFSVSETEKVRFSKGNLQYQASTNTWRFAEHQWDYVGEGNTNASASYDGWIDLFGWGTSGYNHGAVCYQPWERGGQYDHAAYAHHWHDLCDENGQADWGYNAISNGGNQERLWRTCRLNEWMFMLNERQTASGIRYAKATVNETNGLILLPDDWNQNTFVLNNTNDGSAAFETNVISLADWADALEANGAVFLPAAGNIQYWSDNNFGTRGAYWSATSGGVWLKSLFDFTAEYLNPGGYYPFTLYSVRLVCSAASTSSISTTLNPVSGGTVAGAGSYPNGQICTLTATPSAGYTFLYWKENDRVVSTANPYSFAVEFDKTLEACFDVVSHYPLYYVFDEINHTASASEHLDGLNAIGDVVIPSVVTHFGESYVVSSIGGFAFSTCSGITSINIPIAVNEIGYCALNGCSGLTSMTIHAETPPTIGEYALDGIDKTIPVYIPNGTLSAYQNADGWNEFTNFIEMP